MARKTFWLAPCLSLLVGARAASAQDCPQSVRDDYELLRDQERKARIWNWGWGGAFALMAGAQFSIAGVTDNDEVRLDMIVGGSKSAIGAAAVALDPLDVSAPADPCTGDVAGALKAAAQSQSAKRSWFPHFGTVALNVGGGLVVGFVDDRWADAAIQTAIGILVGEIQIFTAPSRARDRVLSSAFAWHFVPSLRSDGSVGMTVLLEL